MMQVAWVKSVVNSTHAIFVLSLPDLSLSNIYSKRKDCKLEKEEQRWRTENRWD